ncbi:MAG: FliM/FliN family flagellar motor switch protein [Planctomycetota bacterium]|jgi:flagellar motor switch protein FliN/FliY
MCAAAAAVPPNPAVVMARAARGLASELASALGAALSRTVTSGTVEVFQVFEEELTDQLGGRSAAFCLELSGVCTGRIAIVFSSEAVGALAGLIRGLKGKSLSAKVKAEFDSSDVEELGVTVAGALGGLAEKLNKAVGETPVLDLGDTLTVPADDADELVALLGPGPYPIASFDVTVRPKIKGHALIVFPASFVAMPEAGGKGDPAEPGAGDLPATTATGVIRGLHANIRRILGLTMPVAVVVADKDMTLEAALRLAPGVIIEFSKRADADLDLFVNHHKIGSGEVVTIGERFGIQVRHIEGLEQRIRKLGAARPTA